MNRRASRLAMAAGAAVLLTAPAALHAWVSGGHTWANPTVVYYVNPANPNALSSAAVVAALDTAASAWTLQSRAAIDFMYGGYTSGSSLVNNGKNEIFFRTDYNGSVAASTYYWWDATNRLVDFDMVIWGSDFQYFTGTSGCSGGVYLEDVATHEFGHALGLAHSSVAGATMYPTFSSYCFQDWRVLDADDIAGVEAMYPPTGSTLTPPAAPTQLAVTGSTTSSLALAWVDNASNEDGYRVARSSDGFAWTEIAQLGSNARSYTSSGLASSSTYYYRVWAYNGAGTSGYSNVASGTTQAAATPPPATAPSAPYSPSPANGATGVNTSADLAWASSGAQSYDVYLGTASQPGLYAANVTSASLALPTLSANTKYYWFVVAKNSVGATQGPTWAFTTKASKNPRRNSQ